MTKPVTLSPAATPFLWEIVKRETFGILVPVVDSTNVIVDITGYSAKAQIKHSETDDLLYEWNSNSPLSNIIIGTNDITLQVKGTDTAKWTFRLANCTVMIYEPNGTEHAIARGQIRALENTTTS